VGEMTTVKDWCRDWIDRNGERWGEPLPFEQAIMAYLDSQRAAFTYVLDTGPSADADEPSSPPLHAWAIVDPRIPRLEGLYRWRPNDAAVAKWEADGLVVKRIEVTW
jgi:hypothetical protein